MITFAVDADCGAFGKLEPTRFLKYCGSSNALGKEFNGPGVALFPS